MTRAIENPFASLERTANDTWGKKGGGRNNLEKNLEKLRLRKEKKIGKFRIGPIVGYYFE